MFETPEIFIKFVSDLKSLPTFCLRTLSQKAFYNFHKAMFMESKTRDKERDKIDRFTKKIFGRVWAECAKTLNNLLPKIYSGKLSKKEEQNLRGEVALAWKTYDTHLIQIRMKRQNALNNIEKLHSRSLVDIWIELFTDPSNRIDVWKK
jgi:hypothetical protein